MSYCSLNLWTSNFSELLSWFLLMSYCSLNQMGWKSDTWDPSSRPLIIECTIHIEVRKKGHLIPFCHIIVCSCQVNGSGLNWRLFCSHSHWLCSQECQEKRPKRFQLLHKVVFSLTLGKTFFANCWKLSWETARASKNHLIVNAKRINSTAKKPCRLWWR